MKYAFISQHRKTWPVKLMCFLLGVSVSGWRRHEQEERSSRYLSDAALLVPIRAIHAETRGAYGSPRIFRALKHERGVATSLRRVERLMREHGIRARGKRKFKATTDSRHRLPVAQNLLERQFTPSAPNERWAGDITAIDTGEGWLYLAVVLDLFSRRLIGWSFSDRITRHLAIDALSMAWFARGGKGAVGQGGLMFHSDRGSQYASQEFQELLTQYEITGSMSRKGNCWDNAVTESSFGSLKVERLHAQRFATREAAKDEALDWMRFYNRTRLHSTLGYRSPVAFEAADWAAFGQQRKEAA